MLGRSKQNISLCVGVDIEEWDLPGNGCKIANNDDIVYGPMNEQITHKNKEEKTLIDFEIIPIYS